MASNTTHLKGLRMFAAQAAIAVSDFLLKVKDIQTRQQVNGDQNYGTHVQPMEDDMDDDDALEQDKQPYIPLPMFRSLCDNLSVARTAGVLNRLDMADLKELLCLLHSQVRVGLHKPIPDSHDDVSGPDAAASWWLMRGVTPVSVTHQHSVLCHRPPDRTLSYACCQS